MNSAADRGTQVAVDAGPPEVWEAGPEGAQLAGLCESQQDEPVPAQHVRLFVHQNLSDAGHGLG